MNGVLVLDKPSGPTSHDVVARVRRATGVARIGHTGTLDPLASGVLPLVLGRASRLAQFLVAGEKEYEAGIRLGLETDTCDITGRAVERPDGPPVEPPDADAIGRLLAEFVGTRLQEPPAFSAKKIAGTRAYALARRGTPVRPAAVPVTLARIDLIEADAGRLRLRLVCSAGFYVRSLARDLGRRLRTGACLESLRRLRSGAFGLDRAVALDRVEADPHAAGAALIPMAGLLQELPGLVLTTDGARRAAQGNLIGPAHLRESAPVPAGRVRLLDEQGRLLAIAEATGVPGFLHPGIVVG